MEQQMYLITVEGEYTKGSKGKDAVKVQFRETFELPITGGVARMEIQNKLISERLKNKDAEFRSWRTCQIVSEKPVTLAVKPKTVDDIPTMTKEELAIFAVSQGLKVNVAKFDAIESAREAVLAELGASKKTDEPKTDVPVIDTGKLKYPELKKLAGELGLEQSGKADVLKARIDEHLLANSEPVPGDDEEFEAL